VKRASGVESTSDLSIVPALLEGSENFWIDTANIDAPTRALLTETLALHSLAVEDILLDSPGPKVEDYGDYLYVVVHGVACPGTDVEKMTTVEIDVVIGEHWLF